MAGGSLFGIVGMLIAVPVTASIGVLTRFAFEKYRASLLYQGKAALAAQTASPPIATETPKPRRSRKVTKPDTGA